MSHISAINYVEIIKRYILCKNNISFFIKIFFSFQLLIKIAIIYRRLENIYSPSNVMSKVERHLFIGVSSMSPSNFFRRFILLYKPDIT